MLSKNNNSLEKYLASAQEISRKHQLGIDLAKVIISLSHYLPNNHYRKLINDKWHGLEHGLDTAKYALLINHQKKLRDGIALSALLHDICGVRHGIFSRANHHLQGSRLIKKILPKIISKKEQALIDLDTIVSAIKYHWKNKEYFLETLKKTLPARKYLVCAIVRDADTIDEALNIERIIKITEAYKKSLLNKKISLMERIAILLCEEEDIIGSRRSDLMMYLLRNVTKGIDDDHYITPEIKKFINKNIYKKNVKSILKGIDKYKYPGNFNNKNEILNLMNDVSSLYFKLKDTGKLKTAKKITFGYSQKGSTYFEKHRLDLIAKLNNLARS